MASPVTTNAAMNPSSIAIRAWTNTVKFSIASAAPNAAVRRRPNSSHRIQNTPITTAVPATVDKARHPSASSPKSMIPAAIRVLPISGCSMLVACDSVRMIRAAPT